MGASSAPVLEFLAEEIDWPVLVIDRAGRVLFATRTAQSRLRQGIGGEDLAAHHRQATVGGCRLTLVQLDGQRGAWAEPALRQFRLTPREREVLHWIAEGKTNPEIAIILGTSRRTIATHVEHILGKLGVENRAAAATVAIRAGYGEGPGGSNPSPI